MCVLGVCACVLGVCGFDVRGSCSLEWRGAAPASPICREASACPGTCGRTPACTCSKCHIKTLQEGRGRVQSESRATLQGVSQVQYDDVPRAVFLHVRFGVGIAGGAGGGSGDLKPKSGLDSRGEAAYTTSALASSKEPLWWEGRCSLHIATTSSSISHMVARVTHACFTTCLLRV